VEDHARILLRSLADSANLFFGLAGHLRVFLRQRVVMERELVMVGGYVFHVH
jgi:hypothetical protein